MFLIYVYVFMFNVSVDREDVQEFRQHDKNNEIYFSFSNLCIPFLFGERFYYNVLFCFITMRNNNL